MTRLVYLPANQAWVFTFGDSLLQLADAGMFYAKRKEAVAEAKAHGLIVDRAGRVTSDEGRYE